MPPEAENTAIGDAPRGRGAADALAQPRVPILRAPVLYPNSYVWYVFFASLDIMMTWIILHLDGREVNWLARMVIETGGLAGTVLYKFALVLLVVVICEIVGRFNDAKGRKLAEWSVAITIVPVAFAALQLAVLFFGASDDDFPPIP